MEALKFKSDEEFRAFQVDALIRIEAKTMVLMELITQSVEQITSKQFDKEEFGNFMIKEFEERLAALHKIYAEKLEKMRVR